jgi:hypothetical protein
MTTRDEILTAALQLSELDRLEIAGRLLETVPDGTASWWTDDEFIEELDRRAGDLEDAVPATELWQCNRNAGEVS